MTENITRQPRGIPVGGQFAATAHTEADLSLSPAPAAVPLSELIAQRDLSRERFERLDEQRDALDRVVQAQSIKTLAAGLLEKYPSAVTLRIEENQDGENQFDAVRLIAADGSILEDAESDNAWIYDEIGGENGPYVEDLIFSLTPRDDRWAGGIATLNGNRKRDFRTADIDLVAARNAPLPDLPEVHDPYQRTFTEDEQKAVVDAAYEGISEMNDKLTERAGDYSPAELTAIQKDMDAAVRVLHRADDA
jgi:hypothetical protein